MSTIDEVTRSLRSLNNLPNYCLRKVREYCPVDNNTDRPASGRLRKSFHIVPQGGESFSIESNSEYLGYVVHGRGSIFPVNAKHLRWNAGGHGNGSWFPSHRGTGYFFSGHAKSTMPNPFIDRAYDDIVAHIERMDLKSLARELDAYGTGGFVDSEYESIHVDR